MTNSNFNPNNQQAVAQNILKCFGQQIDLIKGEGSRGGKVIGHTRSGKPIYDHFEHESHKNFTGPDHNDARSQHDSEIMRHEGTKKNIKLNLKNATHEGTKSAYKEQINEYTKKIKYHSDQKSKHSKAANELNLKED